MQPATDFVQHSSAGSESFQKTAHNGATQLPRPPPIPSSWSRPPKPLRGIVKRGAVFPAFPSDNMLRHSLTSLTSPQVSVHGLEVHAKSQDDNDNNSETASIELMIRAITSVTSPQPTMKFLTLLPKREDRPPITIVPFDQWQDVNRLRKNSWAAQTAAQITVQKDSWTPVFPANLGQKTWQTTISIGMPHFYGPIEKACVGILVGYKTFEKDLDLEMD